MASCTGSLFSSGGGENGGAAGPPCPPRIRRNRAKKKTASHYNDHFLHIRPLRRAGGGTWGSERAFGGRSGGRGSSPRGRWRRLCVRAGVGSLSLAGTGVATHVRAGFCWRQSRRSSRGLELGVRRWSCGSGPGVRVLGVRVGLCVLCEALSRSAAVLMGGSGRGGVSPQLRLGGGSV